MLERLLLTPREASYRLGISTRHLWNLTSPRGPIPVVRLGRKTFYRPEDLANFVADVARQSAEAATLTDEEGDR
ncbi:helix-turn-helix domain-containing protein [Thermopirellula anaerolimosa]